MSDGENILKMVTIRQSYESEFNSDDSGHWLHAVDMQTVVVFKNAVDNCTDERQVCHSAWSVCCRLRGRCVVVGGLSAGCRLRDRCVMVGGLSLWIERQVCRGGWSVCWL